MKTYEIDGKTVRLDIAFDLEHNKHLLRLSRLVENSVTLEIPKSFSEQIEKDSLSDELIKKIEIAAKELFKKG